MTDAERKILEDAIMTSINTSRENVALKISLACSGALLCMSVLALVIILL